MAMPVMVCTATTSVVRRSRSIQDKVTPLDCVPLLVRSRGAELGYPHQGDRRPHQFACRVCDSELPFVGGAGTTESSRPSRRVGVEWTNQYKPMP